MDSPEETPPSKPHSPSPVKAEKPQKAFSCLRCFERKVKCDKQHPCANCTKSNVECIFRIPSAPRRKKKRATEDVLLERLKRAEDLLRSKGIMNDSQSSQLDLPLTRASTIENPESLDALARLASKEGEETGNRKQDLPNPGINFLSKAPYTTGKLIQSHGHSRFVDNNLWTSVSEEFSQPRDAIANDSSDESDEDSLGDDSGDIILGLTPSSHTGVTHLHPPKEALFKLWDVFLVNVNPMTKIIHRPTLEKQLLKATENFDAIPRGLECLMFAIYTCAVGSSSEDDCEKMFDESRESLFKRYRTGCRRALARAKFLGTGDLMVCQSFVLYVLIMRDTLDARTIWTLSGVANRMAQGLGLHRDGSDLGLSVFETELRRRLWWQLIILDFRSAELTGSGRFGDFWSDTQVPNNVDDAEFGPSTTEQELADVIADKGTNRATEMIGCLLRCEFGSFWKEKLMQRSKADPSLMRSNLFAGKAPSPWDGSIKERDDTISELERRLEDKFLRYCDVNNPLQFMVIIIGRGAMASMRLMAHHPRRWANESQIPPEERALLWKLSIKLLESDSLIHSTKALQRFMWHSNVYFQWQALVYLLGELKRKTTGDDVDLAWRKVEETYHHHPSFIVEFRKPLHAAVGSLCLKAWDARIRGRTEAETTGESLVPLQTPDFIAMLREQRRAPTKRKSTAGTLSKQSSTGGSSDPKNNNNNAMQPGAFNTLTGNSQMMNLPILTPSSSSPNAWAVPSPLGYTGGGARPPNTTFSGVPARMPLDMSGSTSWDSNSLTQTATANSDAATANLPASNASANVSPFSGNTQQYTFDGLQGFDPNTAGLTGSFLGPGFGGGMSMDGSLGGGGGGMANAYFGGGHGVGGDVLMGDVMDWNQWDYLIQDYDVIHHPPGHSGFGGGAS